MLKLRAFEALVMRKSRIPLLVLVPLGLVVVMGIWLARPGGLSLVGVRFEQVLTKVKVEGLGALVEKKGDGRGNKEVLPELVVPSMRGPGMLEEGEQASLWAAFEKAQHQVQGLTEFEASLPQNEGVRYFASNPRQGVTARFLEGEVRIESGLGGAWSGTLRYRGSGQIRSAPVVSGERVEFHYEDGVTEWYINRKEGFEHGFTLAQAQQGGSKDEVRLYVEIQGLKVVGEGEEVTFIDPTTANPVLYYEGLKVWDARGNVLSARMTAREDGVEILVATAGAVYPVTVDPLIASLETKRVSGMPGFGRSGAGFGQAVSIAGNRLVIGVGSENLPAGTAAGSAYVFRNDAGLWKFEARLTASVGAASDWFGSSVAIEGSTIVVGAPGDDTDDGVNAGSAVVYVRSDTQWAVQTILEPLDAADGDGFGGTVSLNGDILVIGANGDDTVAGANAGSAYVYRHTGEVWEEEAKLNPLDPATNDEFGISVAVHGETIVVGAPRDDVPGSDSGSIYVFARNAGSWGQAAKLKANDAASGDQFGYSVAFDGQSIAVGALLDDTSAGANAGSVYVFIKPGASWVQLVKLEAWDGQAENRFGYAVAIDGGNLLVGAFRGDSAGGVDSGSAYVFVRSGSVWSLQSKLAASDGATQHFFGSAVALDGARAVIGARFGEGTAGAAYVFEQSGVVWNESQKLTAGRVIAGENFGAAIALEGDLALIGAPSANSAAGTGAGSVFVFEREGLDWQLTTTLKGSDTLSFDGFGNSVALDGTTAVVGSVWDDTTSGNNAGSAYIFTREGGVWSEQQKLVAADGAVNDYFGVSVALSGETVLVGAWADDTAAGTNAGSAYVFERQGALWTQQAKLEDALGAVWDIFGFVVALDGNTAVVGSVWDDTTVGFNAGSVHVFVRDGVTWNLQARLEAGDAVLNANFGRSLLIQGDTLLVGSPYHATSVGEGVGKVYLFERSVNDWSQVGTLESLNPAADAEFGTSLAREGDLLVVGSAGGNTQASLAAGSVEVFWQNEGSWSIVGRLEAEDGANGDRFGGMVALSRGTVIVGAANDDTFFPIIDADQVDHGSIYVFRLTGLPRGLLVEGHGNRIANGDRNPRLDDGTDFGLVAVLSKEKQVSFSIKNTGASMLHLIGSPRVELRGTHARDFRVVSVPSEQLNGGATSTFSLAFDPLLPGLRTAEVWINSDDPARPWYTFAVSGFGGLSRLLPQRIGLGGPSTVHLGEGSVALLAEASSGLPVALEVVSGPGSLAGAVLTPTGVGRVTVRATQAGGGIYAAATSVKKVITVKVDPSVLTLTGLSQRYDGMPKPVATVGGVGTVAVSYQVGGVFGPNPPTVVGRYPVRAVADGVTRAGTLIITPAPLYVVPEDKRRFAGKVNPELTVRYQGFVGRDTAAVLTSLPALRTTAGVTSPGGVYPITARGGAAANYVLVYRQGTMVVESFAARYEALLVDALDVPSGKLSVTVARSGRSFSGSLALAGQTRSLPLRGDLFTGEMVELASGGATVVRNGIVYHVAFELELNGTLSGSVRRNGVLLADLAGRRLLELPTSSRVAYHGPHTVVLEPAQPAGPGVPAGAGWARATINTRGAIALVGRLGDGAPFTTQLLPDEAQAPGYRLWLQPYQPMRVESFLGGGFELSIDPVLKRGFVEEGAELVWAKAEHGADRSYPLGFVPVEVGLKLDPWVQPSLSESLALRLGLPSNSLSVQYSATGSVADGDLPTLLTLSTKNGVSVSAASNPTNWQAKFNTRNGTFTGRFELLDAGLRRVVPFSGVLRQPMVIDDAVIGAGHFLLPNVGGLETGLLRFLR